jgi:hypothetical protein
MNKKHPADSKSTVGPAEAPGETVGEHDRKKLELGDAMEHEHGQAREDLEEEIEEVDGQKPRN